MENLRAESVILRLIGGSTALQVEGLSFRYRATGLARAWTLEQLSFQVAAGEILGIVGPNGSGKSTLLKLLAGLLSPQSGSILLAGRTIRQLSQSDIARFVAVVPQEYVQVFPFTVAETVLMGRFPHRKTRFWSIGLEGDTE